MKSNLLNLFLIVVIVTACKKTTHTPGEASPELKKYNCFCTTTISYVDFCRVDTIQNSNEVSAYKIEDAGNLCKQQNSFESSTSTVTTKNCEIK